MITLVRSTVRRPLLLAPVVAVTCGLLALAGCSSTGSAAGPATQPSSAGQPGGTGRMGADDPGRVSGEIAAVDGKTLQIQDGESQTAVTYTKTTTFTAQVAGTVADIEKGQCVVVFSSSTDADATEVTATSLSATAATDDGCTSGFRPGGAPPSGAPSRGPSAGGQADPGGQGGGAPSGMPSGMPSGNATGMPNPGGRPRAGTVTAVDGDTLTLAVTTQGSDDTTALTVKTTSDSTVTVTEKSKASAVEVGGCATVNGKADDTGAVRASTITLRKADADGCTTRAGNR